MRERRWLRLRGATATVGAFRAFVDCHNDGPETKNLCMPLRRPVGSARPRFRFDVRGRGV